MSIVICEMCAAQIDSDMDVDCFDDYAIACKSCRDNADEAAYDRQQEKLMSDGPDTSMQERQDQQLRDAGRGHLVR